MLLEDIFQVVIIINIVIGIENLLICVEHVFFVGGTSKELMIVDIDCLLGFLFFRHKF